MIKIKKLYRVPSRMMLIVSGSLILLTVMIAASKPQPTSALPGDLSSATSKYPNLTASSLNNCTLCHTASIPSLNPYGAAYKSKGRNTAAFGAIESLDSDGDGFSNIQEINAFTFPGDAASFPALPTATNTPLPTDTPIPTVVVPSVTPTTVPSGSASVTVGLAPSSVDVGGSSTASVSLNTVPAGGFASAEFRCTFNPAIVEVSNITVTSLFGADPAMAINGPQNGSFVVAIAGSNAKKATTDGAAFSFSVKGLQAGQSAIDCQSRASTGNLVLATIPSTPASLTVASTQPLQGTFAGQVLAGKPVTVTLYDAGNTTVGSIAANPDGTFSLLSPAGTYTAVASAPGFLRALGSVSLTNGNTTTLQTITLVAGDIDGTDVIDQFDALTIGINYDGSVPAAADLNSDGIINVLDLEILALNYRQSGPLAWH